tara:strand:+ start:1668 stop:1961 length:294 start_codon:yes stop_codon:yes gene_type:complete
MPNKKTKDNITPSLDKIMSVLQKKLPKEAHKYFRAITPIDTGNARRRTKRRGHIIVANYKYATELDGGHSKQAVHGMSGPTTKYLNKLVAKVIKGIR